MPLRFFQHFLFSVVVVISSVAFSQAIFPFANWQALNAKLSFTTSTQSVLAQLCSGVVSVQTNSASGTAVNVGSNLTVNLSGPGALTFYSDSSCTAAITTITVFSGTSTSSFYFSSTSSGTPAVSASATGYSSVSQTETVSTNNFIWTGLGADANFSTAANWSGGVVPGASDIAVFSSGCASFCNATISANPSVGGLRLTSTYTGTITQASGIALSVGSKGFTQLAGTFAGGNADLSVNSPFVLTGGAFTAPSTSINALGNIWLATAPASYTANCSTLKWTNCLVKTSQTAGSLYNAELNWPGWCTHVRSGVIPVAGYLKLAAAAGCGSYCGISGGIFDLKGDLFLINDGAYSTSTWIKMSGSSTQKVDASSGSANAQCPSLEIASTGGQVNLIGVMSMTGDYTYTSGTLVPGTSTLNFFVNANQNIRPGAASLNNVSFTWNSWNGSNLQSQTMTILGNLSLAGVNMSFHTINNGTLDVKGNLTITDHTGGSAAITMSGSTNTVINSPGAGDRIPSGTLTVNKSGGATVSLAGNAFDITGSGQTLAVTHGAFNMAGFALTTTALSLSSTTLTKGGGVLTVNGTTVGTGSLYGGTIAP